MLKKNKNAEPLTPEQEIEAFIDGLDRKSSFEQKKYKKERRQQRKENRSGGRISAIICCAVAALAGVLVVLYFNGTLTATKEYVTALFDSSKAVVSPADVVQNQGENNAETTDSSAAPNTANAENGATEENKSDAATTAPNKLAAAMVNFGAEYKAESFETDVKGFIDDAPEKNLTAVFVNLNDNEGLITRQEENLTAFQNIVEYGDQKGIAVFGVARVSAEQNGDLIQSTTMQSLAEQLTSIAKVKGIDGLMLDGFSRNMQGRDFADYVATGTLTGYSNYGQRVLTRTVKYISNKIKEENPALYLGVICDMVYTTTENDANGMAVTCDNQLLRDQNADVCGWAESGLIDSVFVRANTTTTAKNVPFETMAKWWSNHIPNNCAIGFVLSSDSALAQKDDWKNPDQLARQLKILNDLNRFVFCLNSYDSLLYSNSEAISAALDFLDGGTEGDYVLTNLSFTAPTKRTLTTFENSIAINGASDPKFKLTMNGKEVERTEFGYFSLQLDLKLGVNVFTFNHKGSTETFRITYRYVVVKSVTPSSALTLDGGSTLMVKALARNGSNLTAKLGGNSIKLTRSVSEDTTSDFCYYMGSFVLAGGYTKNTNIGKIAVTGTYNGVTETIKGGSITVRKTPTPSIGSGGVAILNNDAEATPTGGSYKNVGSGLVATAIKEQIETFSGNTVDDYSQPFNNYLPKGTVDYCSNSTIYDASSGGTYRMLRCGRRVYAKSSKGDNISLSNAKLPSTNTIKVKSTDISGHHTVVTLNTEWKAPFLCEVAPQQYTPSNVNNRGLLKNGAVTFNYIDITFCYATAFEGTVDITNNPLFSKAQVIKNKADYTLRLYLKKTGAFYGYTADYNSAGQLVFKFLNPVSAQKADNKFGGTLNGVKVMVDPGHGGSDGGAAGSNKNYDEAALSLILAQKVKQRLESIGATVVMTRTADVSMTQDARISKVRGSMADFGVSIHRNSAYSSSANGYYSYYFNAYTAKAAERITAKMRETNVYSKYNTGWHYFYISRISNFPIVLTENGFMSNSSEYSKMLNSGNQDKCADAIVKGIVEHFLAQ